MKALVWRRNLVALVLVVGGLGAPVAGSLFGGREAQAQRGPVQRVVLGKVTNKGDVPLQGAVVYLKDDKTLGVKSFIATDQGTYRFGQLSQNTDYEVWAESGGKKSATKLVSSFDSKNEFTINLKIDVEK